MLSVARFAKVHLFIEKKHNRKRKKNRYLIGMCGNKHGIDYISATFYRKREREKLLDFVLFLDRKQCKNRTILKDVFNMDGTQ